MYRDNAGFHPIETGVVERGYRHIKVQTAVKKQCDRSGRDELNLKRFKNLSTLIFNLLYPCYSASSRISVPVHGFSAAAQGDCLPRFPKTALIVFRHDIRR